MEEHRYRESADKDRGQASRAARGRGYGSDHVCDRPRRPRPEIRDRFDEAAEGIGLGAEPAVRGGNREDGEVVSREPGMDGQCHQRRLYALL